MSDKHLGLGASVVLQFIDVLQSNIPDLPYHIYFDNFFSSLKLLEAITSKIAKAQEL